MYIDEAFNILGIEPPATPQEIKKAYAALVRVTHPEDNPEEWERLHTAYRTALSSPPGMQVKAFEALPMQEKPQAAPDDDTPDSLFDDLQRDAAFKRYDALSAAVDALKPIKEKAFLSLGDWQPLLDDADADHPDRLWVVSRNAFLWECGKALEGKFISKKLYLYLTKKLEYIQQYILDEYLQGSPQDVQHYSEPSPDDIRKRQTLLNNVSYALSQVNSARQKAIGIWGCLILLLGIFAYFAIIAKPEKKQEPIAEWNGEGVSYSDLNSEKRTLLLRLYNVNTDDYYLDAQETLLTSDTSSIRLSEAIYLTRLDYAPEQDAQSRYTFREVPVDDITLPGEPPLTEETAYAFEILTLASGYPCTILCCDMETLGFEGDFHIYHEVNGAYTEIPAWSGEDSSSVVWDKTERRYTGEQYFTMLGRYTVFVAETTKLSMPENVVYTGNPEPVNHYPIIIVGQRR